MKRTMALFLCLAMLLACIPVAMAEENVAQAIQERRQTLNLFKSIKIPALNERLGKVAEEDEAPSAADIARASNKLSSMIAKLSAKEKAEAEFEVPKAGEVTYRIWNTNVAITLPSGSYQSSSDSDMVIWACPSLGYVIGFGRSEYASLASWKSSMSNMGYNTYSHTNANNMSYVYGWKSETDGYTETYIYNYGNYSYVIMGVGMTYSQTVSLSNVFGTLHYAPAGNVVTCKIWNTNMAVWLPSGSYYYSTEDNLSVWVCPSLGYLVGFARYSYASLSTWKTAMQQSGCASVGNDITPSGIELAFGIEYDGDYSVTFFYNYGSYSYAIMGAGLTYNQAVSFKADVVDTLHYASATATPAPTATPTPKPTATPAPTATPTPTNINGMIIDADGVLTDYTGTATTVNVPDIVTVIGAYAFANTNVETVIVPEGVEAIYSYAFEGCTNLRNLVLPRSIYYCWEPYGASALPYATIFCWSGSDAHLLSMDRGFRYVLWDASCDQVMKLPDQVQSIKADAFVGVNVMEVIVPDGCESIGSRAFADCDSLVRITIPDSVQSIASDAFSGCPGFLIVVRPGSYAYNFATANGIMTIAP